MQITTPKGQLIISLVHMYCVFSVAKFMQEYRSKYAPIGQLFSVQSYQLIQASSTLIDIVYFVRAMDFVSRALMSMSLSSAAALSSPPPPLPFSYHVVPQSNLSPPRTLSPGLRSNLIPSYYLCCPRPPTMLTCFRFVKSCV